MTSPISTDDICVVVSTGEDDSDAEGEPFVIIESTHDDWDEAISSLDGRQVDSDSLIEETPKVFPSGSAMNRGADNQESPPITADELRAPRSGEGGGALTAAERKLRALLDRR